MYFLHLFYLVKITEGSMAYKMVAPEAPPSTIKAAKPEETQKETTPTVPSKLGNTKPVAETKEFGYIVTNQRYRVCVQTG